MDQPNVAIDAVAVVMTDDGLKAVVAPRLFEPYIDENALPGVLLLGGESVVQAGKRALESKAHISNATFIETLGVYDGPARDPRSTTLTIAQLYAVKLDDVDLDKVTLESLVDPEELPFDHSTIIRDAGKSVARHLMLTPELVSGLFGSEFETSDMNKALISVDAEFNQANLARNLASKTWLTKSGKAKSNGAGRPATIWSV